MTGRQTPERRYTELMGYPLCAHCGAKWPVREALFDRHRGEPWRTTIVYLCRRPGPLSPPDARRCAVLVEDWGHPTPCVDCAGLAGPELGWPGLVWLAARCGVSVEETTEAVTWA
jgi:ribosomal protein L40E